MADKFDDFAHTDAAAANREAKAKALAGFCWDRALVAADVRGLDAGVRRALAREAGVAPPSSGETWERVCALLDLKAAWAGAHPDHRAARVAYPRGRARWVPADRPDPPPAP